MKTMISTALLLCLIMKLVWGSGELFGKYRITQGKPNAAGIRCILQSSITPPVAFRVRDKDGECTILTLEWFSNRTYDSGFTYIENALLVFQNFTEPEAPGEPFLPNPKRDRMWNIPGKFGVGGRLDLYFSMPFTNWSMFRIRIFEATPNDSQIVVHDDLADDVVLFLSVSISKEEGWVKFSSFEQSQGYLKYPIWAAFPFEDGHTYRLTIVAREENYQILFDGIERSVIPYVATPELAKVLFIRYGERNSIWPFIRNMTFFGIA